jgi:hypothetical protein
MVNAVGVIQVRALDLTGVTSEWGFAIGAAFWSTGVFMEAANLVADFAFTTLKVDRLEARAVGRNGRGNGVLHKLGARAEANLVRAFRKDGRSEGQLLWTLREEQWRQRPLMQARFSPAEASEQIVRAIADAARAAATPGDDAARPPHAEYPFFFTDSHR